VSADNYIGVIHTKDDEYAIIPYGNMSMLSEDCQYRGAITGNYYTSEERADALLAAHDMLKAAEYPIEYGVIELEEPDEPCGRCYVCIATRGIVANDVPRCTACEKPITGWLVMNSEGTFHRSCEPREDRDASIRSV
jgi:hypothetical protein